MSIGIGVIGAGVMGADHARTLATRIAGAHLVAISDADADRARLAAEATGAGRHCTDGFEVVDDPNVDAVLVASPDATHPDYVLACLEAGKPVLCEKPLAPTPGECLRLVDAEVATGRRLIQVGYMRRFDSFYGSMRDVLRSGELGRPLLLHCAHRNASVPSFFTADMSVTNSAVHEFDIIRWLLDRDITAVTVLKSVATSDVPDGAAVRDPLMLLVETEGGVLADVEIFVNARYGYDIRAELVCERGTVSLARPRPGVVRHAGAEASSFPGDWRGRFAGAYASQLQAWVASFSTDRPAGASAWDGYVASAVAEEALRSLASGQRAEVRLAPKPDFYGTTGET